VLAGRIFTESDDNASAVYFTNPTDWENSYP